MGTNQDRPYQSEAWLRQKYVDERLTLHAMADECGVSHPTISRWMDKYGIERRDRTWNNATERPSFRTTPDGYETANDGTHTVRIHRLIAVAECGFDAVAGKDVHHISHIPWDNRPSNLTPFDHGEHMKAHGDAGYSWPKTLPENRRHYDREWLHEQYVTLGRSTYAIAGDTNVTAETVRRWLDELGIERRKQWER